MGSKSTVIHVTEEEVWERIRAIYAEWPEFLDYPMSDWCRCCYDTEVAEIHGWDSDAYEDWLRLRDAVFLAGMHWDHPKEDE